jgi:hypothetical protein
VECSVYDLETVSPTKKCSRTASVIRVRFAQSADLERWADEPAGITDSRVRMSREGIRNGGNYG